MKMNAIWDWLQTSTFETLARRNLKRRILATNWCLSEMTVSFTTRNLSPNVQRCGRSALSLLAIGARLGVLAQASF